MPDDFKTHLAEHYPQVRLSAAPGFLPLADLAVTMLVGLTGTGKSTTLDELDRLRHAGAVEYYDDIPSRRELADWIIIPSAQVIGQEGLRPVKDRAERFALTRRFAQEFDSGGSAAAYGWLFYHQDAPLLSDGLRGPGEIAYALAHYLRWRIIELWVDPLTRLQRLSNRGEVFDQAAVTEAAADMSFLPGAQHSQVQHMLASGEITAKAIITARAEAQNYGGEPYDRRNQTANYRCLLIDDLEPGQVAQQVIDFMTAQH